MRLCRRTSIATIMLVALAATQAWGAQKAQTRARTTPAPQFKSVYKPGLKALSTGPLVRLGGNGLVDAAAYKDISAAAQHLLKKYPADKHYFIGLGRDPAPIIAFLQNLGGKQLAINFPASSNQSGSATVPILARYVKKLVPPEILRSNRTIVFVDATSSGRALDHYVPLITPSLGDRKVIKAAFGVDYNGTRNTRIYTQPGDKQVIATAPFPEVNKFYTSPYEDAVGEYPRHGPGLNKITVLDRPRAAYGRFRAALMKRMERDKELHDFLAGEAGPAFATPRRR